MDLGEIRIGMGGKYNQKVLYTHVKLPKIINKMGIFLKRNGFDSIFLTLWPHGHGQVIQPPCMSFFPLNCYSHLTLSLEQCRNC